MSSVNRVFLTGNVGRDPEIRSLSHDGSVVANFTLATSDSWTDKKTGERKNQTEWHKIVIWNQNLCEYVKNHLQKGDHVRLEGKLQYKKWTDSKGNERVTAEVVIPKVGGDIVRLSRKISEEYPNASYVDDSVISVAQRLNKIAADRNSEKELFDEIPF